MINASLPSGAYSPRTYANPSLIDHTSGGSVLHQIIANNTFSTLECKLNNSAEENILTWLDQSNEMGDQPLHTLCQTGSERMFEALLKFYKTKFVEGNYPIKGKKLTMLDFLEKTNTKNGKTALHLLKEQKDQKKILILMNYCTPEEINKVMSIQDNGLITPKALIKEAKRNIEEQNAEVVSSSSNSDQIPCDTNASSLDFLNQTRPPLALVETSHDRVNCKTNLLNQMIINKETSRFVETMNACDSEMIKQWLETEDNQGCTPLHLAIKFGNLEIVPTLTSKMLEDKSPNFIEIKNSKDQSPYDLAIEIADLEIIDVLTANASDKYMGELNANLSQEQIDGILNNNYENGDSYLYRCIKKNAIHQFQACFKLPSRALQNCLESLNHKGQILLYTAVKSKIDKISFVNIIMQFYVQHFQSKKNLLPEWVKQTNYAGETALYRAVQQGDVKKIDALMSPLTPAERFEFLNILTLQSHSPLSYSPLGMAIETKNIELIDKITQYLSISQLDDFLEQLKISDFDIQKRHYLKKLNLNETASIENINSQHKQWLRTEHPDKVPLKFLNMQGEEANTQRQKAVEEANKSVAIANNIRYTLNNAADNIPI